MKNVKAFLKNSLPVLLIIIYFLIIHVKVSPVTGDDLFFKNIHGDFFKFILSRYSNWSSRVLIEYVLVFVLSKKVIFWKILDFLVCILCYFSLNKILNKANDFYVKLLLAILMIIYPFNQMKSAGWGATTINYLWPMAMLFFSFIVILKELSGDKYSKWLLILFIPAFMFAINQEQVCALSLGYLLLFNIYYFIKNKKINKTLLVFLFINVISLIFILTCPGNRNRMIQETITWFSQFKALNILEKLSLGINNAFDLVIGKTNYLFIAMLSFICLYFFRQNKNYINKILSFILLFLSIIIPDLNIFRCNDLYIVGHAKTKNILNLIGYGSKSFWLSIILAILFFIGVIFLLYQMFKNDKDKNFKYFVPIIFISGILSLIIVGFSPTIYASAYRTAIFMFFSFIIIIVLIIKKMFITREDGLEVLGLLILFMLLAKKITLVSYLGL